MKNVRIPDQAPNRVPARLFLLLLFIATLLLLLAISVRPRPATVAIQGTVIATNETQSLDGIRRYLLIHSHQLKSNILVKVSDQTDCPAGYSVTLAELHSTWNDHVNYRFISCNKLSNVDASSVKKKDNK